MTRADAVIVAAGRGLRFGAATPKQYSDLAGRPVLRHTVERFLAHPRIGRVQVVVGAGDAERCAASLDGLDLPAAVVGGATRQASVRAGLEALAADPPAMVLIHDAARPLVDPATIGRVVDALDRHAGAVPALPVSDTLLRVAAGTAGDAVDRSGLWRAQTPQGFRFAAIMAAHRAAAGRDLSDDVQVARLAGLEVAVVEGDEDNFKITAAADLARAARVLAPAAEEVRVGSGFDVHRFGPGDHVVLGGVRIAHGQALVGHSDADVVLHALTDAILGGLADGDIGQHFPPSDPRWRGADSGTFVRHGATRLAAAGGRLLHADLTVISEGPRIGPHREAMRAAIAALLAVEVRRVAVKATTTERLGLTGRREGIAAMATVTLGLPA